MNGLGERRSDRGKVEKRRTRERTGREEERR